MSFKKEIILNRFGLGAKPNELNHLQDPEKWLFEQLTPAIISNTPYTNSPRNSRQLIQDYLKQKTMRKLSKISNVTNQAFKKAERKSQRQLFHQQMVSRLTNATETNSPVYERLVQFWSNHFAVSVDKKSVLTLAFPMEEEAIRPYTHRHFSDLLTHAIKHPAMQLYLDNTLSIGPQSPIGKKRNKGINENLAREILELHTLGVDGGYTQNDVISLANALTGWSIKPPKQSNNQHGALHFNPRSHEPGKQQLLGKTYANTGEEQVVSMLQDLALNPATARHLCTKLLRHFSKDQPQESDIKQLTKTYLKSDGFLPDVYQQLFTLDSLWHTDSRKFKTPNDLVISVSRLFNTKQRKPDGHKRLNFLGQPPFQSGSPAGWADTEAAWNTPNMLYKRLQWIEKLSGYLPNNANINTLATDALGNKISQQTLLWISRAESPQQALTVLLMSPDFQRR